MKKRDDIADHIDTLTRFVQRVERVNGYEFINAVRGPNGASLSCTRRDDGQFDVVSERRGPTIENIDAVMSTFRILLQPNDKISIPKLETIYSSEFLSDFAKEFQSIQSVLNTYLDGHDDDCPGGFNVKDGEKILSRRQIMNAFIYAEHGHSKSKHRDNDEARRLIDRWKRDQYSYDLMTSVFVVIVTRVWRIINGFRDLNLRAIAELNKRQGDA